MSLDAIIVGAGPNGLAAAITLARAGLAVRVVEANEEPGGGARTLELTLPGFLHDVCSTVHPLGVASPFFATLDLPRHGLAWIDPPAPLAHVREDGRAVMLERSLDETARRLGRDGAAYRRLIGPFVDRFGELMAMFLGPLRLPSAPLLYARFGLRALRSMEGLARGWFREGDAPALLASIAAHAMLRLDSLATASFGLVLATAGHAVGWPIARGGSRSITAALLATLRELGGELELGHRVADLRELPPARATLLDVTPRQLLAIAGDRLPSSYRRRLGRFRYGPGVFKIDWALRAPLPWRDRDCARACTVHLAGSFRDIAASEEAAHRGVIAERPFVLLVQPSLFDASRAPAGGHVLWAYCHVPSGSTVDMTAAIEAQIERAAPGFKDLILARVTKNSVEMEAYDANYVGGDVNGGQSDLGQLFFRPVAKLDPYATPARDLFLCSSSTPPGGGVHGMCGHHAARSALARVFGRELRRAPRSPRRAAPSPEGAAPADRAPSPRGA